MQHRYTFEAVDCTLRDLCKDPQPFEGSPFCFYGDFHQILPVVLGGRVDKLCQRVSNVLHSGIIFTDYPLPST